MSEALTKQDFQAGMADFHKEMRGGLAKSKTDMRKELRTTLTEFRESIREEIRESARDIMHHVDRGQQRQDKRLDSISDDMQKVKSAVLETNHSVRALVGELKHQGMRIDETKVFPLKSDSSRSL